MSPGRRPNGTPSITISPNPAMPRPIRTSILPNRSTGPLPSAVLNQADAAEKIADFERRRFRFVRTVRGVALDGLAELLAQRAGVGLCRIGRAHECPPFPDGVGRLQDERDGRAR